MKIDYKFKYIWRDDYDIITKATIKFYEGEYNDVVVHNNETEKDETVNKYVRSKLLATKDYTANDFGKIKRDDELRVFLNGELKKDMFREPIDCQKETDLEKIKLLTVK